MKYLLCAFLIGLFVTSSLAGDKKYAQEGTAVEIMASGDGTDCDNPSPPLYDTLEDFIFDLPSDFHISGSVVNTRFTYPSDSLYFFELDYFCPPPNFFSLLA